ncbi:MAG: ribonucleoside-diphosphate reductase, adenosylcobalamin-dependent [Candidatus Harrisonbacteria bacterium CG10_big_fil_rev_8_21_14_0_10_40_38]|uniref:Vitamin B12-dependent ribonucleotide reductase n=1 Tax=Candidatus Harrisonbacteria bacterium CG10_big_fil_rev_8_21_14_0_10_40_38 TaxID=1974583 RepID=A0A2H0URJ4_9BACT|nr:MAG: ribonucleoside-diphosphate reductase, adenosylcobalamin-dependent [Candidatus Harrisonbacteria bacterium CG10_big_fil_rev_8_21_14_0_10_40_38]
MPKTKIRVGQAPQIGTSSQSLNFDRVFTKQGVHPFDAVTWVKRDAVIESGDKKVFEQYGVEFPDFWSQNAVNITTSKYFRGKLGSPERETSLKQMITRVAHTIRVWGEERFGYFDSAKQAELFELELSHMILHQQGSFNSPVWFNVGVAETPQCSACFILSVEDNMPSILEWISNEGMIFKGGSGAGNNLSAIRSKQESLSKGGKASGPVSFMRGADSVAGMIKSGGTTRRAAKMVILNIDHPDIMEFIRCKAEEEKKVQALRAAGFDMSNLNNEAWTSIQFQNANNSVRITDDFMEAAEQDEKWNTRLVTTGEVADTYNARELLLEIAEAAWECGDPGVQFDTTINNWHTCPNSGRINGSNPCSEYMHIDNSACNLASINLLKFLRDDGLFSVREFMHAVRIFILAQDIIVDASSYPTELIAKNARDFRQLGLGFANLGALLMTKGLPYASEEGQAVAGAISSVLCGEAYRFSAEIAGRKGAFAGFEKNKKPMLRVIGKHKKASKGINYKLLNDKDLADAATSVWEEAYKLGEENGFRNSQVTVIAPTGTIALMMDCDTTGIEPDFSLIKYKQLVGGGWMTIVNNGVPIALERLGYTQEAIGEIIHWIKENETIEGAPHIKEEHLSIFDCAVRPAKGTRSISWKGHVKLVAAVQPFISGAISKTFNMDKETTKEEIADAYIMAWKLGIKAFAVYRDGSKSSQPLQTSKSDSGAEKAAPQSGATRRRLPSTRMSETHKFSIAGHEGYLTYSLFEEDGELAEIFLRVAKQGSTLAGLLDSFAISVSMALQYGVPVKDLCHKFIHSRFEPAGYTKNPDIQVATSIIDYIFRYIALRFLSDEDLGEFGMEREHAHISESVEAPIASTVAAKATASVEAPKKSAYVAAGTVCKHCGGMMVRTGSCMTCLQCGTSSGGCS